MDPAIRVETLRAKENRMIEKSYQDAELTLRAAATAHASALRGSGGSDATQQRLDEACLYMYEMADERGRDGHPNDD
jgi:hypothetical protein